MWRRNSDYLPTALAGDSANRGRLREGRNPPMSFFKWEDVKILPPCRRHGGLRCRNDAVGSRAEQPLGDGRSISHARVGYRRNAFRRGLPRTTHGRRVEPAHRILEDCLTLRSAPGRTGRWSDQDGAGATSCPIAQMNPHSSRAIAVTTTVGFFPVALSLR